MIKPTLVFCTLLALGAMLFTSSYAFNYGCFKQQSLQTITWPRCC